MVKLFTSVQVRECRIRISPSDRTVVLGSCFADRMGLRMKEAGFDVCVNPFGTVYNPESLLGCIGRLDSGEHFTEDDCVEMGAGAGLVCSFHHHSSFARRDAQTFLSDANAALDEAAAFWKGCSKVLITLGTAMVWRRGGQTVSNCLKRPAAEFTHEMLTSSEVEGMLEKIVREHPDKEFVFTISPIRHLGEGAHSNQVSKATLLLGLEAALAAEPERTAYFPSYEILLDELRDYRFYADDLCHPSETAAGIIWERFLESAVPGCEHEKIREAEKESRRNRHIPLH